MIDWLTLKICTSKLDVNTYEKLKSKQSRIIALDADGAVQWEKHGRKSVRSDSHVITYELGTELRIYGSPTRVGLETTDNVFGTGNITDCAERMISHVEKFESVELPTFWSWSCTRIDVTHNYYLGSRSNVMAALGMLRHAEGGRYQVGTSSESVYWSSRSTRRSGKAYPKGPHLDYLARRGRSDLTVEQRELAQGLLRFELSLRRHWFSRVCEKDWFELTESDLNQEFEDYFGPLVGSLEITDMTDLQKNCIEAAESLGFSQGIGRGAWLSWNTIRAVGYAQWRESCPRSTFYRHKKVLQAAGLSYADFNAGNVVELRRRKLVLDQPVTSWAELANAA